MQDPFADLIPQQSVPQAQQPRVGFIPGTPRPGRDVELRRDEVGLQRDNLGIERDRIALDTARVDLERKREEARQPAGTETFEHENTLRNDFQTVEGVGNYLRVLPMFGSAVQAADNPVGDMQIITAWAKTYDPTGTVRDQDVEISEAAQSYIDRIRATPSYWTGDGRLRPDVRRNFMLEIRNRGAMFAQQYNAARDDAIRAARAHGLDPTRVVGSHPAEQFRQYEEALMGRTVGNVPLPTPMRQQQNQRTELRFLDELPENTNPLTPEQQAAYDNFVQSNPNMTAAQLQEFAQRELGLTLDNAQAVIDARAGGFAGAESARSTEPERLADQKEQLSGQAGLSDLLASGATFGLRDEASGVGGAIYNALSSPFTSAEFDPVGAYQNNRDADRIYLERARDRLGGLGTAAEIVGGFASGRPTLGRIGGAPGGRTAWEVPNAPQTLLGRSAQGAITGAGAGATAGFGYGEGTADSIRDAFIGAGGGATLGALLPGVVQAGRAIGETVRNVSGNNPNLARQAISRAIADDGNTPAGVGSQITQARSDGVPMMLADTGDNARGLLAASARAPGPARTLARDALDERQVGLGERVSGAIERDLGPASNPHQIREQLMSEAQQNAAPLYQAFEAHPGAPTFWNRITSIRNRPSMRSALARAERIAAEEGRDPRTLGFDVNAVGEVTVTREPSWQTIDYIKRGLDDVLQAQPRDQRGRLILNEETRAIQDTLRAFRGAADGANPHYRAAREAWGGPARARDAMDLGLKALNMSADDLTARTADLTPGEQQFFQLGIRRAMAERISSLGDTANVAHALLGTGKKRAMLQRVFGGRAGFERFVRTLQAEQAGHRTFQTARLGSPTAPNIQDDAALANITRDVGLDMMTTGVPGIATTVRQAIQFGTGQAGRKAQEQIAALLSESDPTRLRELAREIAKQAARARATNRARGRQAGAYGKAGGFIAGSAGSAN